MQITPNLHYRNGNFCFRVRELEEAAKQARIAEEERIRAAQAKKLPSPVSDPVSEDTIIVMKNPLRDLGQQPIVTTPTGKFNQKITDSYEITPRGCDKVNVHLYVGLGP